MYISLKLILFFLDRIWRERVPACVLVSLCGFFVCVFFLRVCVCVRACMHACVRVCTSMWEEENDLRLWVYNFPPPSPPQHPLTYLCSVWICCWTTKYLDSVTGSCVQMSTYSTYNALPQPPPPQPHTHTHTLLIIAFCRHLDIIQDGATNTIYYYCYYYYSHKGNVLVSFCKPCDSSHRSSTTILPVYALFKCEICHIYIYLLIKKKNHLQI